MRRALACIVVLAAATGCGGGAATTTNAHPDFRRALDALVTGPNRIAPGATAYVSGPQVTWAGAAGWSNVTKQVRMTPDARMRLESVSKLWTATVVAKLAEEKKLRLDDTVAHWLPGLFPDGSRITVRELLDHTSGMIDNNDLAKRPAYWLGRIGDPELRAEAFRAVATIRRHPTTIFPRMLEIRIAAALPLLYEPGTTWHYSNIAYMTAGVIAEKAGGAPLADLYERIIIEPLGLKSVGYFPDGPIAGPHPIGYSIQDGGYALPATNYLDGTLQAEGGIVSNAQDEARFLVGLVTGKVVDLPTLSQIVTGSGPDPGYGLGTVIETTCAGRTYDHNGGGASWSAAVAVTPDGKRVAVVLLNGQRRHDQTSTPYYRAMMRLFCAA